MMTQRQRNGAWFGMRLAKGWAGTSIHTYLI